jgi:NAD-specific glutamate dehydrogenase
VADCIAAVRRGDTESDTLNRLVLVAGLDWRQVNVLRAYRMYRQRIGSRFTAGLPERRAGGQPGVTAKLVRYFELRFDPARTRDEAAERRCATRSCRPRRRSPRSTTTASCATSSADRRDAAHRTRSRPTAR